MYIRYSTYVSTYVCKYVCCGTCKLTYKCTFKCINVHMYKYVYVNMYVHKYIDTYIYHTKYGIHKALLTLELCRILISKLYASLTHSLPLLFYGLTFVHTSIYLCT